MADWMKAKSVCKVPPPFCALSRRQHRFVITTHQARELLSAHGRTLPQSPHDWNGTFELPEGVKCFYQEVGPDDITIKSYGNPWFLPRLSSLWSFQAGYRWHGVTGEQIPEW